MVENSLYHEYRSTHPERFRLGNGKPITDELGRTKNDPCFGCIVDTSMKAACAKCRNEEVQDYPRQTKLNF